MQQPALPERWIDCPRSGQAVPNTRFVPFKVPLSEEFDPQVPLDRRFHPLDALSSADSDKRIGLVIDLTKTSRFYSSHDFTSRGVQYFKLPCEGHGSAPTDDNYREFAQRCTAFLAQRPDEYIGVHCTHGFNRTGFLIASYMVEELGCDPEYTLMQFAQARPPGIYKAHYIADFCKKYGVDATNVPVPELPNWDNAEALIAEAPGARGVVRRADDGDEDSRRKRSRPEEVTVEGVPSARLVTGEVESEIKRKVAQWTGCRGFPGSQPVSLDSQNIHFLDKDDYRLSWKADGTRYMMLIMNDSTFLLDRDDNVIEVDHLIFPQRKDPHRRVQDTLLDGELVQDVFNGVRRARFLIFDVVLFQGQQFGQTLPFTSRLQVAEIEICGPRQQRRTAHPDEFADEPLSIRVKPFYPLSDVRKVLAMEVGHEKDGLVLQPPGPYVYGRCHALLKWKPPELNSVDFLLMASKTQAVGCLPEYVGTLYMGGANGSIEQAGRISFPNDQMYQELNGRIIECRFNTAARGWEYLKTRTDKSYPNASSTVQGVIRSIRDNITEDIFVGYLDKLSEMRRGRDRNSRAAPPHHSQHHRSDPNRPQAAPSKPSLHQPAEPQAQAQAQAQAPLHGNMDMEQGPPVVSAAGVQSAPPSAHAGQPTADSWRNTALESNETLPQPVLATPAVLPQPTQSRYSHRDADDDDDDTVL